MKLKQKYMQEIYSINGHFVQSLGTKISKEENIYIIHQLSVPNSTFAASVIITAICLERNVHHIPAWPSSEAAQSGACSFTAPCHLHCSSIGCSETAFSPSTCAVQDHTLDRPDSPGVQALITAQISCTAWSLSHKIIWSECRDRVIHQYSEQKHKKDWKPQLFHSLLCAKETSPARDYNGRKSRKPSCHVFT